MEGRLLSRYLAIDLGTKRIGLAISDPLNIFATGLDTISRMPEENAINDIVSLCSNYKVKRIIIGLPKNMNGTEGFQSDDVKTFTEKLKSYVNIDITLQDERLTSVLAQRILHEQNISPSKHKGLIDKKAAELILQQYLDSASRKEDDND
jgi:putative Holliday junction resolvase